MQASEVNQPFYFQYRLKIILSVFVAALVGNAFGSVFALYAGHFMLSEAHQQVFQGFHLWLNVLPFSTAIILLMIYFYPLSSPKASLEIYRLKILNLPVSYAIISMLSWVVALLQTILIPLLFGSEIELNSIYLTMLFTFGIGLISTIIGYYYIEFINRKYWIPRLFHNRLEDYREKYQPSISMRFFIYFFGFTIAPIIFFMWIFLWVGMKHDIFTAEQYIYVYALVMFILIFGFEITKVFSRLFEVPLLQAKKATDAIKQGDYEVSLTVHSNDEIGVLSERLNLMTNTLKMDKEQILQLNREIEETQNEVVFTMGAICETRSKETGNHVKRVAEYSRILAEGLGLNEVEVELIKQASPLHDIGKVAIPDKILNKPARYTPEEHDLMKKHAQIGYDMLKKSSRPLFQIAAIIAHEHHEKYDGTGYPRGLKGEDIHLYGRITALADVFDALGSQRVYKDAWQDEAIFELFEQERGKHFDPQIVDLFFERLPEILQVRDALQDV